MSKSVNNRSVSVTTSSWETDISADMVVASNTYPGSYPQDRAENARQYAARLLLLWGMFLGWIARLGWPLSTICPLCWLCVYIRLFSGIKCFLEHPSIHVYVRYAHSMDNIRIYVCIYTYIYTHTNTYARVPICSIRSPPRRSRFYNSRVCFHVRVQERAPAIMWGNIYTKDEFWRWRRLSRFRMVRSTMRRQDFNVQYQHLHRCPCSVCHVADSSMLVHGSALSKSMLAVCWISCASKMPYQDGQQRLTKR